MHAHSRRRWLDSVWEAHPPRQFRFDPIASVTRQKASDAPDTVPDRSRRRCQIQRPNGADL